ncbi:MAG: tetratricopeptide repeat protein, partial [Pyrinomonadaceae bacterium]
MTAYKEAVRLQPNNGRAFANLANTQYVLDNYPEAIKNYQKAAELKPDLKKDADQFLTLMGYAYLMTNDFAAAIKTLTQAAAINPQDHLIYVGIGSAQMQFAPPNFPAAIEALNQAAKLDPEYKDTFLLLTQAHIQSSPRNPNEALQAARRAEQLAPNSAETQFFVGAALAIGQLWEPAEKALEEAVRLDPKNGLMRIQLCNALMVLKKYQEGLPQCQEAVRLSDPENRNFARITLANMYAIGKRYNEAIIESNAVIKEQPNLFMPYQTLGITYFLMKKYDKAIVAYKQAINLQPELAELHLALGALYWEAKKKDEALKEYAVLLNLNPKYAEQLKIMMTTSKK